MKSVTTLKFRKLLGKLPHNIQNRARNIYLLWLDNPNHPSLHFKQIHSADPIYSVRVGLGYRALGVLENDLIIWFWIGSHEDYNIQVNSL